MGEGGKKVGVFGRAHLPKKKKRGTKITGVGGVKIRGGKKNEGPVRIPPPGATLLK